MAIFSQCFATLTRVGGDTTTSSCWPTAGRRTGFADILTSSTTKSLRPEDRPLAGNALNDSRGGYSSGFAGRTKSTKYLQSIPLRGSAHAALFSRSAGGSSCECDPCFEIRRRVGYTTQHFTCNKVSFGSIIPAGTEFNASTQRRTAF